MARIKTKEEYDKILEEIDRLWNSEDDNARSEELMSLIEEYDEEFFPIPLPSIDGAIRFMFDQTYRTVKEMADECFNGDIDLAIKAKRGEIVFTEDICQRITKFFDNRVDLVFLLKEQNKNAS